MNDSAIDRGQRAPADNGKLIVFHRNLESLFADARHLDLQLVGIAIFAHAGNGLIFSWTGEGFVLQHNADLSNPNGWSDVPSGDQSPVNLSIGASGNSFYRLRKP